MLELLKTKLLCTNHCLSVSSPNNFGKSTLLRKLGQLSDTPELLIVYLDFNLRADDSAQAFYELIQRRLLHTFKAKSLPFEKLEKLYCLHSHSTSTVSSFNLANKFLAAVDEALQILAAAPPYKKLILLFDEFDQPLQYLPDLVLLQLRALKDCYPEQLSYVTATLLPILACGREEQEEGVAEFYELFNTAGLLRLGGLKPEEAFTVAAQVNPSLTVLELEQVYLLSGGHPVLTRLVAEKMKCSMQLVVPVPETNFSFLHTLPASTCATWKEFEQNLKLDQEIRLECARLWRSLPEMEQQALLHYLEGIENISLASALGSLVERGLVIRDSSSGTSRLFARVFEWFVREKFLSVSFLPAAAVTTSPLPDISVSKFDAAETPAIVENISDNHQIAYDPRRELVVFVNDKAKPPLPLTGNAARLFKYLFMRQSEPYCTKDELITAIWGCGGYSTENLDKLVSDLRQEIGDFNKQLIRTIPRRGLQMVNIREWHSR